MQNGLVSVIIPNYNYAMYIGEAMDSALAQTYSDVEVIVVDDGSSDESRQLIESYGDRIKAIFQENSGVAAARNNGVAESNGEFIAFLDADDIWLPKKIERQVELFADGEIGLVHAGVLNIDKDGNEIGKRLDGLDGSVTEHLLLLDRSVILGGGSGIMLRRSMFDTIGGFDTRMSTSADWDLFLRTSCVSKVGFIPEVLVKYRVHGSNMHSNVRAMEHDMVIGFDQAFAAGTNAAIKSRAYSNLNLMFSGSYFHAGQYADCVRTGMKSLLFDPMNTVKRLVGK